MSIYQRGIVDKDGREASLEDEIHVPKSGVEARRGLF